MCQWHGLARRPHFVRPRDDHARRHGPQPAVHQILARAQHGNLHLGNRLSIGLCKLALGQYVTITWQVEGDVEQTALFRNKEPLWEDAPLQGALADCPPAEGQYEYAIGAQGSGGRNYGVATLRVIAENGGAPAAQPAGPTIARFSVQPDHLTVGGCVDLQWAVSGETANLRVLRDDAVLLDGAPATGSGSDCPSEPGLRRYQLAAADAGGETSVFAVNV